MAILPQPPIYPDDEEITVAFEGGGVIDHFTAYSFDEEFGNPCPSFSLEIGDDQAYVLAGSIAVGQKLTLSINGKVQANGTISNAQLSYSRGSGHTLHLSGYGLMRNVVNSCMDPETKIVAGTTLEGAIKRIFNDYGFKKFDINDDANRNIITGSDVGYKISGSRLKAQVHNLQRQINHILSPKHGEGSYEFVARVAKRFGLHLWLSADGETVIAGHPDYDSPSLYKLYHNLKDPDRAYNNVLEGSASIDWDNQVSMIIAEGSSGGGNFQKTSSKIIMLNEFTAIDYAALLFGKTNAINQGVLDLVKRYKNKGSKLLGTRKGIIANLPTIAMTGGSATSGTFKPSFLYDQYSHNTRELEFFTRRKMSELQTKFFTLNYTVAGHSNQGSVWAVNTMCSVEDNSLQAKGNFWIKRRTLSKSRSGGTTTRLELLIPYTLDYGEDEFGED
jgi:prophage tail gpP-like protein